MFMVNKDYHKKEEKHKKNKCKIHRHQYAKQLCKAEEITEIDTFNCMLKCSE